MNNAKTFNWLLSAFFHALYHYLKERNRMKR